MNPVRPLLAFFARDKRFVWQFADHEHFKTINQLQLLDVRGDPAAVEILR